MARRKRRVRPAAAKRGRPAKRSSKRGRQPGVNKSSLVREFRAANSKASVAEIRAHLAARGVSISTAGIYQALRTKGAPRRAGKRPAPRKATPKAPTGGLVPATVAFIKAAGGLAAARQVLELVAQIQGL